MGKLRSTSLIVNTNIQHQRFQPSLKSKISVMKMFIAFALLIATVAALPMETEERMAKPKSKAPPTKLAPAQAGPAETALAGLSDDIAGIDTKALDDLAKQVGDLETDIPDAIEKLEGVLATI